MRLVSGAQLELLISAQIFDRGAPWPPPAAVQSDVDPLLAAGLLVLECGVVKLSAEGATVITGDTRSPELRDELIQSLADDATDLRASAPPRA